MKKQSKKLLTAALALTLGLSLTACGTPAEGDGGGQTEGKPAIIGISQYGQHASLDNCREGFLQGLKEAGLEEGTDYTIDYQNAGFDDNMAIQIGQAFIPVIFTAITDPVGAKLDSGNITGTSDVLPVEGQLKLIRALQPEAKTVGIIYTTSEANSLYSVEVYKGLADQYGFTIDAIGVTAQSEVTQAVDTLINRKVDCLSNLTDNNVVGVLGSILEKTNDAGIPVYGSEIEQMKLGCVGGAGLDYVALGVQTGKMAARILKGEAACQDIPYEVIENYALYINSEVVTQLNLTLPDEVKAEAQDVVNA